MEAFLQGSIDFTRRFVPEPFTPLFYTAFYSELTQEQRLRYNQLHGCYCNEQIMFFEKSVAENVLSGLLRARETEPLLLHLRAFLEEERRHAKMFYDLNRLCWPHFYEQDEFYFVLIPPALSASLRWATRQPRFFPLFVWLMLLQEERAVFLGREVQRLKEELEPHFVTLQRIHLADEIGHVQWDQEILALTWSKATLRFRKMNVALFRWVLHAFMITPKRANLRVLDELLKEFPELTPRLPGMRRALLELGTQRDWNLSLYSRSIVPKTFALFDRWPEFSAVSRILYGYQPIAELNG